MREMICIMCPKSCHLKVFDEDGLKVTGNACPRGEEYGIKEVKNPIRVVSSTVKIKGALLRRCPVKTDRDIPKNLVIEAVRLLDGVELHAPVKPGDIVVPNILGTGVNFIVTKDMAAVS